SIRDLLRSALEESGYAVEAVSSGERAIELVRRRHYSHVLLDVRMGEVDGVQAAKRIAQLSPRTVVVFVTAYPTALLEAPRGGTWPALVLRKPFDLDEVERVLELQRS
ncbi:MAG: response regulator, partial [Chloroflexi bacterium]|nr:response regulator [Chloroflexota bacterium]